MAKQTFAHPIDSNKIIEVRENGPVFEIWLIEDGKDKFLGEHLAFAHAITDLFKMFSEGKI